MTESLLPIAPGLDEPLEILAACHGRIEQQLQTLAKLLDHLPQHGADQQAQQAARAVLRYFDTAGRNHHADEEENLFPLLRLRAVDKPHLESALASLLGEHQQMETLWQTLQQQLLALADGDAMALDKLTAENFSQLYRNHIARENVEILPLAARLLTAEDVQQLSRAMTARRQSVT
jgi:hemerythrin-like domain-containing protein